MGEPIIYLRRDGQVRRLVGPHAETLAETRIAEGWERFTPPLAHEETTPEPEPVPIADEQETTNAPLDGAQGAEPPADDAPPDQQTDASGEPPTGEDAPPKRTRRGKEAP